MTGLPCRLALCFLFIWCCFYAALPTVHAQSVENRSPSAADMWIDRSSDFQRKGELQRALFYCRLAAQVEPDRLDIRNRLSVLIRQTEKKAEHHFRKGIAYDQCGRTESARREFIIALRYDPNHVQALDYLIKKLVPKRYSTYTVKRGDTFKKIAEKTYRDDRKDFIVARFNDMDPGSIPPVGKLIKLPLIEVKPERGEIDTAMELRKAAKYFQAHQYEKVLPIVNHILKNDPYHEQADEMKNISYYQLGKRYHEQKEYTRSLRMYQQVDPEYQIVETAIAGVIRDMHAEAEDHYRKGIKCFVNDKFRAAILEWAKALTLNPEHAKAKADIEKARAILKKLEETE